MIILDTDHLSFLQLGGVEANRITRRLEAAGIGLPITTIISYEEQVRGWLGKIGGAKKLQEEVRVYAKLHQQLNFYRQLEVMEFTEKAAVELQRLRGLHLRVPTMDLKIAAITLANDAVLWTRNLLDFRRVPGLKIEDATIL